MYKQEDSDDLLSLISVDGSGDCDDDNGNMSHAAGLKLYQHLVLVTVSCYAS